MEGIRGGEYCFREGGGSISDPGLKLLSLLLPEVALEPHVGMPASQGASISLNPWGSVMREALPTHRSGHVT